MERCYTLLSALFDCVVRSRVPPFVWLKEKAMAKQVIVYTQPG